MLKRIARIVLALVLIRHTLIHLGIIPGGIQGPDGRTGWSGASASRAIGSFLRFVAGALGLFGVPFLKERWKGLTIAGAVLALLLFAVTWTGILPHPSDAVFGKVVSGVLLVGLLVDLLLERAVLKPRPRHAPGRP